MINIHAFSGRMGNEMFRHAYLYAQAMEGIIPDVYVQDYKYFEKYADEIKQLFGQGIGYLGQVGVHIRRAGNPANLDEPKYFENPFYVNLCDTDYYEKAMAMFFDDDFLIFSDDPEWCKEKFKDNKKVQVMDKGDEVEDFNLLASCKSLIIANSSYSWWAAYLNPNPSKKVIAPLETKYYSDNVVRTKYPSDFIQIDFNKL